MPMSNHIALALSTDTALADLYNQATARRDRIASYFGSLFRMAGADFYYRGRQRVTDMTRPEAEAKCRAIAAEHGPDASDYTLLGSWNLGQLRRSLEGLDATRAELVRIEAEMAPLEAVFAEHRWSRFFLVTSSAGHIHSSMSCSTCRPTTAYGWLPSLSGKSEADAVAEHGPALCSTCFASAPVEMVGGKITKAQAAKKAA